MADTGYNEIVFSSFLAYMKLVHIFLFYFIFFVMRSATVLVEMYTVICHIEA